MDSPIIQRALFVIVALVVASCAWLSGPEPPVAGGGPSFEIIARDDPRWPADAASKANLPPGKGGISAVMAIRVLHDTPVYRLWTDGTGHPSGRIGPWWLFDPPTGTDKDFRKRYAVCEAWNPKLNRLAACTLARGTIVAIGPTQSVDAATCNNPDRPEGYKADPDRWQVYIPKEQLARVLACPASDEDARLDSQDLGMATRPCTLQDQCKASPPRTAACCR